jgi:hypothetical protein
LNCSIAQPDHWSEPRAAMNGCSECEAVMALPVVAQFSRFAGSVMNIAVTTPKRLRDVHGGLVQPVLGQIVLCILAALMLDGGITQSLVFIGVVLHWSVVGFLALRRPHSLTKGDVVLVRYGFLLYSGSAFVLYVLAALVWMLMSK